MFIRYTYVDPDLPCISKDQNVQYLDNGTHFIREQNQSLAWVMH